MGFAPSPTTEDLAAFLQGLPPGAHVAVNLRGLDMEAALEISQRMAETRNERFIVIGHRAQGRQHAPSLGRALPLSTMAPSKQSTWVVVDADASIKAGGAKDHSRAEEDIGVEVSETLTVVCFYTEEAAKQVTARRIQDLHSIVAVPGAGVA